MKSRIKIIEEVGRKYDEIIFEEDYIPRNIYTYQIKLRNEIIDKHMKDKIYKYTLDFGCGTGYHLETLSRHSENTIGIDMSLGALKRCKEKVDGHYLVCDANKPPFKGNSIDFIWIAGVLHHMPDDLGNVISNIAYILKKDGVVLIDEPNKYNLFNILNMKLSKADPTGEERPLSSSAIEDLLKQNGFTILEAQLYEFFSPVGVLLGNQHILDFCNILDGCMEKTPLKKISLRWYILARKN